MSHPHPRLSIVSRTPLDSIDHAEDALAVIALAMASPPRHETIAFLLDDQHHTGVITVVSGTERPDALFTVVEVLCTAGFDGPSTRLVVASIRPDTCTLPGDVDRWLEASSIADQFDIELVEWFVVGPCGPECPRDLLGEPERW